MTRWSLFGLMFFGIVMFGACGPQTVATISPSPQPTPTFLSPPAEPTPTEMLKPAEPPAPEGSSTQGELAPGIIAVAQPAVADLSMRLGIQPEQVTVVEVKEMEWPDTSLGCPRPGMAYAQVLTNGMQVILEVDGTTYSYHGRSPGDLFLCGPKGPVPPPGVSQGAEETQAIGPDDQEQLMVETVVDDLASTLGITGDEIEVVSVEPMQWRDSSLGCPKPGQMYLQVITPGYKIVLEAGGETYEYHTDTRGRFVLCQ